MAEIYVGIEAASSFVFVLSSDSISSKICLEEVAHAVQYNKTIIPLVYRAIDPLWWPALSRQKNRLN